MSHSTVDPQTQLNAFTKTWKKDGIEPTAYSFTSTHTEPLVLVLQHHLW